MDDIDGSDFDSGSSTASYTSVDTKKRTKTQSTGTVSEISMLTDSIKEMTMNQEKMYDALMGNMIKPKPGPERTQQSQFMKKLLNHLRLTCMIPATYIATSATTVTLVYKELVNARKITSTAEKIILIMCVTSILQMLKGRNRIKVLPLVQIYVK
ncbi:hypothetical protein BCR42DRAFT_428088 [Absidia repens]|uniref:Uncharacterized protein n=1 Tax=Absidia repens TaxID=90262 RepID=A0A1X2I0F2_9FUNG|nr:hypothetical protein BCR42DRAFT_428088 [Absidia repens]